MQHDEIFNWVPLPFDVTLYTSISEAKQGKRNLELINKSIKESPFYKQKNTYPFCSRRIQHNNECIQLLESQIRFLRNKRGFNNSSV